MGVHEVLGAANLPGVAEIGSDPAVERLGEVADRERALCAPGVQGRHAVGEIELEERRGGARQCVLAGSAQDDEVLKPVPDLTFGWQRTVAGRVAVKDQGNSPAVTLGGAE